MAQLKYNETTIDADESLSYGEVLKKNEIKAARKALAVKVGETMYDLNREAAIGGDIELVDFDSDQGKLLFWHSSAHVLAQAIKRIWPQAKFDDGPALMSGPGHFFYDIQLDHKITEEDFEKIEAEIAKIIQENHTISRRTLPKNEALEHFKNIGEIFKVNIIQNLPEDAEISLYQQGEFEDLCRGPHVPSTGRLGFFKITSVAGAYYRNDPSNPMLQRVYAVSFPDKKSLKQYFFKLEEAKKRDHRRLGKELNFFHMQPEAPGMVFWHDRGYTLYRTVEDYIRNMLRDNGYHEVKTPQIVDISLWQKSGHAEKFGDDMFFTESENRTYAVKPMNCPGHIQVFNQGLKSYRDLPLRMAEFGSCHRNEPSGTLHGLMRVRNFTQDDAHIFCAEDQILSEVSLFIDLLFKTYKDFGFENIIIKLSTRPEKRVGSDEVWDKSEKALEQALQHKKLDYQIQPGEGAFYGPKIEFSLKDSLDRVWQCGTIQCDFSMPERLGATYVNADGDKETPVMLHRAILGSIERFLGILVEHYAGKMPLWLSPVQVKILTVSDEQHDYASTIADALKHHGFRTEIDLRNEKIGYKIREWNAEKINYALILGKNEKEQNNVTYRTRSEKESPTVTLNEFIEKLKAELPEPV